MAADNIGDVRYCLYNLIVVVVVVVVVVTIKELTTKTSPMHDRRWTRE